MSAADHLGGFSAEKEMHDGRKITVNIGGDGILTATIVPPGEPWDRGDTIYKHYEMREVVQKWVSVDGDD